MRDCRILSVMPAIAGMAAAPEGATMDAMKARMPVMPEVTPIIPDEAAMLAVLIIEEAVARPIAVIERAVIIVVEAVIGDRLAHPIGPTAITRPRPISRGAAREQETGHQGC